MLLFSYLRGKAQSEHHERRARPRRTEDDSFWQEQKRLEDAADALAERRAGDKDRQIAALKIRVIELQRRDQKNDSFKHLAHKYAGAAQQFVTPGVAAFYAYIFPFLHMSSKANDIFDAPAAQSAFIWIMCNLVGALTAMGGSASKTEAMVWSIVLGGVFIGGIIYFLNV